MIAVPDDDMRRAISQALPETATRVWDWRTNPPPADITTLEFLASDYSAIPPDPALLAGLPHLRAVQVPSSGVEGWPAVLPPGVQLCNGTGVHSRSTAEAALSGILAVLRALPTAVRQQATETWKPVPVEQLSGRRVLILGAGDVAQRLATAVRALDCPTTLVGRRERDGVRSVTALPTLLPGADVLVIVLPLTSETTGLIDAKALALLPDHAVVANVARGPVVNTDALTAEVAAGRLRCYLDVTDPEPLPPGHPLWSLPGALITPHTGGNEIGWRQRYQQLVIDQVRRLCAGHPLHNIVADGPPAASQVPVTSERKVRP